MKKRQKIRNGLILFSFFLFPAIFYYLSPVVIIRAALNGVINGSFVMFCLLFVFSLLLGRAWCGWLCPGAGCQEALFLARDKKVKKGDRIKWFLWFPWISAIILLAVLAGGYKEVDFFYETNHGFSIGSLESVIAYFCVLLLLIVLPGLVFGKRSFCHHLCWMAEFMIIGRTISNKLGLPSLRLRSEPKNCSHCHICNEICPMSLKVEGMVHRKKMENAECILCGSCVDGCESGAIAFAFRKPAKE